MRSTIEPFGLHNNGLPVLYKESLIQLLSSKGNIENNVTERNALSFTNTSTIYRNISHNKASASTSQIEYANHSQPEIKVWETFR